MNPEKLISLIVRMRTNRGSTVLYCKPGLLKLFDIHFAGLLLRGLTIEAIRKCFTKDQHEFKITNSNFMDFHFTFKRVFYQKVVL